MMYAFMKLEDETEIVHSEILNYDEGEHIKVYFEKPIYGGFQSAECFLPEYRWENNEGFSQEDIKRYDDILKTTAHLIIRFARQGGLGNASSF